MARFTPVYDSQGHYRSSRPGVFLGKGVLNNASNLQEKTYAEVGFK